MFHEYPCLKKNMKQILSTKNINTKQVGLFHYHLSLRLVNKSSMIIYEQMFFYVCSYYDCSMLRIYTSLIP